MEADICTDATAAVNLQFALHSPHFLFHDYKCNNLHIKFFDLFTQDILMQHRTTTVSHSCCKMLKNKEAKRRRRVKDFFNYLVQENKHNRCTQRA